MGFHYLQIDNGIWLLVRYILISVILGYLMVRLLLRLCRTCLSSERNNMLRLLGAQTVIITALGITAIIQPTFDVFPIASSLAILVIIQSVIRGEMFNVIDRGREVLFEHIREVFIIVDSAFGYVDANAYAKELFPELKNKARSTCISPELHYYFKDAGEEFCIGDRYFRKKVSNLSSITTILLVEISTREIINRRSFWYVFRITKWSFSIECIILFNLKLNILLLIIYIF